MVLLLFSPELILSTTTFLTRRATPEKLRLPNLHARHLGAIKRGHCWLLIVFVLMRRVVFVHTRFNRFLFKNTSQTNLTSTGVRISRAKYTLACTRPRMRRATVLSVAQRSQLVEREAKTHLSGAPRSSSTVVNNLAALSSSFAFSLVPATRDDNSRGVGVVDLVRATFYLQLHSLFFKSLECNGLDYTKDR